VLEPSYEIGGAPADRPKFPGQRFELTLKRADLTTGTALLNIEAPGTGLLSNLRTLSTFLASIVGFTGLFIWLYRLRAEMLVLEERLAQREGGYA